MRLIFRWGLPFAAALALPTAASAQAVAFGACSTGIVFPVGIAFGLCPSTAAGPARVFSLLDSMGVNTHLGNGGTWYTAGNYSTPDAKIQAEIGYLGFTYIRDSAGQGRDDVITRMVNLNKMYGTKVNMLQTAQSGTVDIADDVAEMVKLVQQAPGALFSYEGSNEYNNNSYALTYNGTTTNSNQNYAFGAIDDQATQAAIAGNSTLAAAGVLTIAASTSGSVPNPLPSVSPYASASNWHVYAGNAVQLRANLVSSLPQAQAMLPGYPAWATEAGAGSAPATSANGYGSSGDTYTQGIIVLNAMLDGYAIGFGKTFDYELMDDALNSTAREDNFGFFDGNGAPKPAGTNLHNLRAILADTGSIASTFTTTAANFSVNNLPSGASSLILQKSSGVYDILIWNSSVTIYNTSTSTDVTPATTAVTIALGGTYSSVKTYDPVTGTAATATASNASSVTVGLAGEPQIVEVTK